MSDKKLKPVFGRNRFAESREELAEHQRRRRERLAKNNWLYALHGSPATTGEAQ